MATETTNYKFTKPAETDYYDVGVQNNNWDLADKKLKDLDANKVSASGGDISETKTNVEEPSDSTKYPAIPTKNGVTKTTLGYLTRWVKSLKDDKVDVSGGDIANTKVSEITPSTASFPTPAVNDAPKTFLGKINKWFSDCLAKFGNYVLMSMITNQQVNSTNNIPTSALVYAMQQAITRLNSDLNTRSAIPDLLAEADKGANCKRIVLCSANTKNTPYTAGLLTASSGTAILCMSSVQYGDILYIPSGNTNMYIRRKSGGTWETNWYCISLTNHNHDSRYYTESEVDSKISSHNHDGRYYTEDEIDSKIAVLSRSASKSYAAVKGLTVVSRLTKNIVILHVSGFPSGIGDEDEVTLATLDSAYRPPYDMPWSTFTPQGEPAIPFLVRVLRNGQVRLNASGGAMNNQNYINVIVTYGI